MNHPSQGSVNEPFWNSAAAWETKPVRNRVRRALLICSSASLLFSSYVKPETCSHLDPRRSISGKSQCSGGSPVSDGKTTATTPYLRPHYSLPILWNYSLGHRPAGCLIQAPPGRGGKVERWPPPELYILKFGAKLQYQGDKFGWLWIPLIPASAFTLDFISFKPPLALPQPNLAPHLTSPHLNMGSWRSSHWPFQRQICNRVSSLKKCGWRTNTAHPNPDATSIVYFDTIPNEVAGG